MSISSTAADALPEAERPLLFAHRGCSVEAPENTFAAFDLALSRGVPGIELDIQQCASGELIVFHDFGLSRITGVRGKVTKRAWHELSLFDAGSWFAPAFSGERIPRLSDLFERYGSRFYYDIEVKHGHRRPTGLELALVKLIRRHGLESHCIVSSFNPFAVRTMRVLAPWLPGGLIFSAEREVPRLLRRGAGRLLSAPLLYKPHHKQLDRPAGFLKHALGDGAVIPWTVNDSERARKLIKAGVAGLISDRPAELLG